MISQVVLGGSVGPLWVILDQSCDVGDRVTLAVLGCTMWYQGSYQDPTHAKHAPFTSLHVPLTQWPLALLVSNNFTCCLSKEIQFYWLIMFLQYHMHVESIASYLICLYVSSSYPQISSAKVSPNMKNTVWDYCPWIMEMRAKRTGWWLATCHKLGTVGKDK